MINCLNHAERDIGQTIDISPTYHLYKHHLHITYISPTQTSPTHQLCITLIANKHVSWKCDVYILQQDLLKINKLKEKNVNIIIEREKYIYTEIREKQNT